MSRAGTNQAFVQGEIEALEAFGVLMIGPAGSPLDAIEVTRGEGGGLEVRIPGRPPIVPTLTSVVRERLRERGFRCDDPENRTRPWAKEVSDAAPAVALVWRVLTEVFDAKSDVALDIAHGSHKAEHEAHRKLAETRALIEKPLCEIADGPLVQDDDGDYVLAIGDVQVTVAPRVLPGGRVILRIFSVANIGVQVTPELGLFLARLNFGLMFGSFALDAENRAIWFAETLLGDQISDDLLKFTVDVVSSTADEWDDRLKQMFGGDTYQEILKRKNATGPEAPTTKPGEGGYL